MFKALLKKQFLEMISSFLINGKTGKKRSRSALLGFGVLMVYVFGVIGFLFWEYSGVLCAPLALNGLSWVYFALIGIFAVTLGVFITVFSGYTKLYKAKDNDLMLSLPLPSWMILFSRLLSLYALAFLFGGLIFIPALIKYFLVVGVSFLPLLFSVFMLFLLPLGALFISCLLGLLISFISVRLPAKNILSMVFAVAFILVYFWGYSKINTGLQYLILHGATVGGTIKKWLFPLWQMGLACTGKALPMLWAFLLFFGSFTLLYLLLCKTFLSVVMRKEKTSRVKYSEGKGKSRPVFFSLLKKESLRLLKNPMLFLNCAIGSVLLLLLPVLALFNIDFLQQISIPLGGSVALILALILCGMSTTNLLTASSVSLEGESLWVLRSLPIKTSLIFAGKIFLHFLFTGIPVFLSGLVLGILLKISALTLALALIVSLACCLLFALLGLAVNLKFPNLHWTNEVVVAKQGLAPMLTMFSGMGMVLLLVGGYFLFGKYMAQSLYLCVCLTVLLLANFAFVCWLKKRGEKIFENL